MLYCFFALISTAFPLNYYKIITFTVIVSVTAVKVVLLDDLAFK